VPTTNVDSVAEVINDLLLLTKAQGVHWTKTPHGYGYRYDLTLLCGVVSIEMEPVRGGYKVYRFAVRNGETTHVSVSATRELASLEPALASLWNLADSQDHATTQIHAEAMLANLSDELTTMKAEL
jgi:hypothetical protein